MLLSVACCCDSEVRGRPSGRRARKGFSWSQGQPMQMTDWSDYQKLVLHRLDSNEERLVEIDRRLRMIENKVERIAERLAITAAAMGFAAGLVPVFVQHLF